MIKIFLLLFCLIPLLLQGKVAVSYQVNQNPKDDIAILENEFISAKFSSIGGKLIALKDKRNNLNLTYKEGALRDNLLPNGKQPFPDAVYKISVSEKTPQRAALTFVAPTFNEREFILLTKKVILESNSTVLKVEVTLTNQQESMANMALGYWLHNFFGGANLPTEYIVPLANGIKKSIPSAAKNTYNYQYDTNLVRNWCAMNVKGKKAGVVLIGEYPRMDMTYSWYCKPSFPMDTLELRTFTEIIPQGQSRTWKLAIGVANFLDTIDGAGQDGCGQFNYVNGKAIITLYGFNSIKGQVEAVVNNKVIEKYPIELKAGNIKKVSFTKVAATQVAKFVVRSTNGKVLYDLLQGSSRKSKLFSPMGKRNGNQELAKEEWNLKLDNSLVTPHWKWSNTPISGKGLFLVPVDGIRDVIEIAQRMSIKFDAPTIFPSSYNMGWKTVTHFDPGDNPSGAERIIPLLKNNKYKFIVIGSELYRARKWLDYPANVRKAIFEQVKNGAGLVCFNQTGFTSPAKLVPLKLSSAIDAKAAPWFPNAKFAIANYGKGKIITVNYPEKSFIAPLAKWRSSYLAKLYCDHRFQEYQFAIIGRLIRQAMNINESITLVKLTTNSAQIVSTIAQSGTIELFNRYTNSITKKTINLKKGLNVIPLALEAGKNYLHVSSQSGSFGFASFDNKVKGITSIEMKNTFKRNEIVSGSVKCDIPNAKILVEIFDNEGRLLYYVNSKQFAWNQALALGNRHEVVASAYVNNKKVATLKKEFYLPEQFNTFQNFPVMVWTGDDSFPEYSYIYRDEISRQFGFNFIYGSSYSCATPLLHRFANLESGTNRHENGDFRLPLANLYDPRFHKTQDKKYLTRKFCPSDPKIKNRPMYSAFYAVTPYTTRTLFQLGDEMSLTAFGHAADFCFCQYCMKEFRLTMQNKYGSLAKLNKEWKSSFAKWEDVLPQTYTEAMTQASPASFYDFRAFMDQVFIGKLEATRQKVRKVHPKALCGPTGVSAVPGIYGGNLNFWAMSIFDCGSYYKTPRIPASFRRDARLVMQYFGYSSPAGDIRFGIWESLLAGCRGINNWYDPTFILPNLRISYAREYYSKLMWEIRNSVGEILYHTPKLANQAAILHSQHSLIANYLKTDKVDYYNKELAFAQALDDIGIAYRFISPSELENGSLKGLKLLVLPETSAMSNKEIEAVRAFCQNGGIVLADYECGLYNENGNIRSKAAFDDMFGIRRTISRMRRVTKHNIPNVSITNVISGVRPTTGVAKYTAWAGNRKVDLVIENNFGKGKAIMLNFAPKYNEMRNKNDQFAQLVANLVKVTPIAKVETSTPIMHSFFQDKDALTIALLPLPTNPKWRILSDKEASKLAFTAPVKLATKGHVYDVRKKKYLGYGSKVNAIFIPGEATVLSVTKEKPQITFTFNMPSAKLGQTLKISAKVIKGNRRFILMRVYRPDGKEDLSFRQMRTASPNWTFTVPFAFNAPQGQWKITFDDAASNIHYERQIIVK